MKIQNLLKIFWSICQSVIKSPNGKKDFCKKMMEWKLKKKSGKFYFERN